MKGKIRLTYFGKPFSECDHLINDDGQYLFCKYWKPAAVPRYLIFMIHGIGGNCSRFEELADRLKEIGGYSFSHDHVGHGESEGVRMRIQNYCVYIRDVFKHIDKVRSDYPDLPVFLLGHSMGGALAVLCAHSRPQFFRGVVLMGAQLMVHQHANGPLKRIMVYSFGRLIPCVNVLELHDPTASRTDKELEQDLINPNGGLESKYAWGNPNQKPNKKIKVNVAKTQPRKRFQLTARTVAQLLRVQEKVVKVIEVFAQPFIALHGSEDKVCSPEGTRRLDRCAKSTDKTVKIYEGCNHDLLREHPADRRRCMNDIAEWINQRCLF